LVIDSPNRKITQANRYIQPEHTLELTDDEIVDLLICAGFCLDSVKGIWNCRRTKLASNDEVDISVPVNSSTLIRRKEAAIKDPSGSFIWWAVAKKKNAVDSGLRQKVEDIYFKDFPGFVRARFSRQVGKLDSAGGT